MALSAQALADDLKLAYNKGVINKGNADAVLLEFAQAIVKCIQSADVNTTVVGTCSTGPVSGKGTGKLL